MGSESFYLRDDTTLPVGDGEFPVRKFSALDIGPPPRGGTPSERVAEQ